MLITIDGYSGAGKTTQSRILHEQLGIEHVEFFKCYDLFHTVSRLTSSTPHDHSTFSPFAALNAFHTRYPAKLSICETFWQIFSGGYSHNPPRFLPILNFLRHGMNLQKKSEPILSIALEISQQHAGVRAIQRNSGLRVEPVSEQPQDAITEFWKLLEAELPYFHRIDAAQPIADITSQILKLIPPH